MYNNKAIRRVVRAGRRSTIGNRVTGYNLFEGSNPLLSAKNEKAVPQGMAFSFLFERDSNKEGARLCLRKKTVLRTVFADAVKEHRDAKAYGSMPKKSLALRQKWKSCTARYGFFFFICKGIRTRRDQALPAEENSHADCFRRRGQGASRREGIRQYAEKIPC